MTDEIRVGGEGPVPAEAAVVGQSPGRVEAIHRRPFVGPSGQLLDEALAACGLDRRALYVTNAVSVYLPGNPPPERDLIAAERPRLIEELHKVHPRVVLALGDVALRVLTGMGRITDRRGQELPIHRDYGLDAVVVPTYHPAAVLRDMRLRPRFVEDVAAFARALRRGYTEIPISYEINPPFAARSVLYVDVETRAGELCLIGLKPPGEPCALYTPEGFDIAVQRLREALVLFAWNAQFDLLELRRHFGDRLRDMTWPVGDPMFMVYLLDEEGRQDLKSVVMQRLGVAPWERGIRQKLMRGEIEQGPELWEYNARDLTYMEAVHRLLEAELQDLPAWRVYEQVLCPATWLCLHMRERGLYVSLEAIAEARLQLGAAREEARARIRRHLGDVNPHSPKQLAYALYTRLGLPAADWTAHGFPSTAELALRRIQDHHPVIQDILAFREAEKLLEFVEAYQDLRDEAGRIHPNTTLTFTVTGRTSAREPNIQQIPRDPRVRRIIAAPPGKLLVSADYSQLELRVCAFVSREPVMLDAYRRGLDLHTLMASRITGKPESEVTAEDRYRAKPVNFGFLYCAEPETYREQLLKQWGLSISAEDAQAAYDMFHLTYAGILPWYERVYAQLRKDGYVETVFGRRRRLPNIMSEKTDMRLQALRQGVNFLVQSTASDLMLIAATRMDECSLPVCAYIHDAVLLEVEADRAQEVAEAVRRIMEDEVVEFVWDQFGVEWDVPLVAEIEISRAWGEKGA